MGVSRRAGYEPARDPRHPRLGSGRLLGSHRGGDLATTVRQPSHFGGHRVLRRMGGPPLSSHRRVEAFFPLFPLASRNSSILSGSNPDNRKNFLRPLAPPCPSLLPLLTWLGPRAPTSTSARRPAAGLGYSPRAPGGTACGTRPAPSARESICPSPGRLPCLHEVRPLLWSTPGVAGLTFLEAAVNRWSP